MSGGKGENIMSISCTPGQLYTITSAGAAAAVEDTDNNPEVTILTRQTSAILLNCLTQLPGGSVAENSDTVTGCVPSSHGGAGGTMSVDSGGPGYD
jgi:hypothetical protein